MKKRLFMMSFVIVALLFTMNTLPMTKEKAYAQEGVELFTSYRELTSSPGESVSYGIDVINNKSTTQLLDLSFENKYGWKYDLTAGGKNVQKLAVKPNEYATLNLRLDVPLQVEKGKYTFQVVANQILK